MVETKPPSCCDAFLLWKINDVYSFGGVSPPPKLDTLKHTCDIYIYIHHFEIQVHPMMSLSRMEINGSIEGNRCTIHFRNPKVFPNLGLSAIPTVICDSSKVFHDTSIHHFYHALSMSVVKRNNNFQNSGWHTSAHFTGSTDQNAVEYEQILYLSSSVDKPTDQLVFRSERVCIKPTW